MKVFLIALVSLFTINQNITLNCLPFVNIEGDCNSQDSTLHFDTFAFACANSNDTLAISAVTSFYCGSILADGGDENLTKEFFQMFHHLTYNSINYPISNVQVHLMYYNRINLGASNTFLIELDVPSIQSSVAFVYGSNNQTDTPEDLPISYAYMVSLDSTNPYASGYTPEELSNTLVYNQNGSYLYEIKDTDRDNMLVGFKYYSPRTQSEYIKFILPNN